MCLRGTLCLIPFNLIYNMFTFRKKCLTFNVCLHVAAFVIAYNLICSMTMFC